MAESNDEPRDSELVAYLDGELDERSTRELEQKLQTDPELRQEADTLKRTWELLDFLPQPEPTPTFTSRTLDKLTVLRPSASQASPVLTSTPLPVVESPTRTVIRPARRAWAKWAIAAVAAVLLFAIGYLTPALFTRSGKRTLKPGQADEQMAKDLRVVDNLALYQFGDDLAFLFKLDQPDLFGEETGGH
jgi:anti-sigma factor RsiW